MLLCLTIPPGSELTGGSIAYDPAGRSDETWETSTDFDLTVQTLRPQLPVDESFEGVAWCNEDDDSFFDHPGWRTVTWSWATEPGSARIDVQVAQDPASPRRTIVFIMVEGKSEAACLR
jgi:hypothetical protein